MQGGEGYVPQNLRISRAQKQGEMNNSTEKPLITSAYGRVRKDTVNSTREAFKSCFREFWIF